MMISTKCVNGFIDIGVLHKALWVKHIIMLASRRAGVISDIKSTSSEEDEEIRGKVKEFYDARSLAMKTETNFW